MELFRYLKKGQELEDALEIYDTVFHSRTRARASTVYSKKVAQSDVLDDVLQHALTRFDPKLGRVENFVNKTLSTVDKSKYEFEVPNSEAIERKMNKAQKGVSGTVGELPTARRSNYELIPDKSPLSENVEACMDMLGQEFFRNLETFMSTDMKRVHGIESDILEDFDFETVNLATQLLLQKYQTQIHEYLELKDKAKLARITPSHLCLSMESTVKFVGYHNDIVMIMRQQGYHSKDLYKIDVKTLTNLIVKTYYNRGKGMIKAQGQYFLTLSGDTVDSMEEAIKQIEAEIVYTILNRNGVKVVHYEPQGYIILSTTKKTPPKIAVNIFGKELPIQVKRVAVKEILTKTTNLFGQIVQRGC